MGSISTNLLNFLLTVFFAIQTENSDGQKPCEIDGAWCDTEDIKEEIFVILGERPTDDVLKVYKKWKNIKSLNCE